jgi:hypothetical protein
MVNKLVDVVSNTARNSTAEEISEADVTLFTNPAVIKPFVEDAYGQKFVDYTEEFFDTEESDD